MKPLPGLNRLSNANEFGPMFNILTSIVLIYQ